MPTSDGSNEAHGHLRMLEEVVETANDAVLVTEAAPLDEPGPRIVYVNPAFTRMTGYAAEEVLGRSPRLLQGPETDRNATHRIRAALDRAEPVRVELANYRKDGSLFYVDLNIVPVRDARGRLVRFASVQRDTTERRTAEDIARRLAGESAAREEASHASLRLEAILESVSDGFVVMDRAWRYTYVNERAAQMLGRPRSELLGKNIWEVFPEFLGTQFEEQGRRAMDDRVPVYYEERDPRTNRWLEVRAYPTLEGISVYLHDVTARRKDEEARRRLTAILEATPDVVGTADLDGRMLYLNAAGRGLLGARDRPVEGRSFAELLSPDSAAHLTADIIPAAVQHGCWRGEIVMSAADGCQIPVSQVVIAHRGANGEVEYLSTIIRDISERKRVEEEQLFRAEASRRLSASLDEEDLLRTTQELLVPRLADYCVIDLVDDSGQVWPAALLHRDPGRQPHLEALRRFEPVGGRAVGIERAFREGLPALIRTTAPAGTDADGQPPELMAALAALGPRSELVLPLWARAQAIGAITCVLAESGRRHRRADLALAEDLAQRISLAMSNAHLFRRAQQAVRVRDEVLRIVAHDLRSPLRAISLTASMLLDNGVPPGARRPLGVITRSVERADKLIDDLLDAAQLQEGRLSISPRREDAAALVREAVELHRPQAEREGTTLLVELPQALPRVMADRDRLLQVFANLIGNAVKFAPGGRVTARAEARSGEVRFEVADTGPGASAEQVRHFFEPFWQARSGGRDGAGLGLAIAKGIVEAHGGHIVVHSELGIGTTVCFTVPSADG